MTASRNSGNKQCVIAYLHALGKLAFEPPQTHPERRYPAPEPEIRLDRCLRLPVEMPCKPFLFPAQDTDSKLP